MLKSPEQQLDLFKKPEPPKSEDRAKEKPKVRPLKFNRREIFGDGEAAPARELSEPIQGEAVPAEPAQAESEEVHGSAVDKKRRRLVKAKRDLGWARDYFDNR